MHFGVFVTRSLLIQTEMPGVCAVELVFPELMSPGVAQGKGIHVSKLRHGINATKQLGYAIARGCLIPEFTQIPSKSPK